MNHPQNRRLFIRNLGLVSLGATVTPFLFQSCSTSQTQTEGLNESGNAEPFFKISLAQWSLHKTLFAGDLDNLDFPEFTKNEFGIEAVEFVNAFFKDKGQDKAYLSELKKRCTDHDIERVLIMVDGEGFLGDTNEKARIKSVDDHKKWVEAAQYLDCHSIRVNAFGRGTAEEVGVAATDGLRRLAEYAKDYEINIIVENHGSYSSDGQWLTNVIKDTEMANCGTLPDFGNFCIKRDGESEWEGECIETYDRYQGVAEMMPFAKGVSAKANDFDDEGNCIETDYVKMMQIVKDAGYTGHVGIEYEGNNLPEVEGIKATLALLQRVGSKLG